MQHFIRIVCLLVAVTLIAPVAADAGSPLNLFKRIEADPDYDYPIADDNGPWMVLAVTFRGEYAQSQARELVYELRKRHKIVAYTHVMNFDFSTTSVGRGVDRYGAPRIMQYNLGNEFEEIAVLVGNYEKVDDPAAQKLLKELRYLHPTSLKPRDDRPASRPLAGLRAIQKRLSEGFIDENRRGWVKNVKKGRGPMGHAFLTTNPLLPREYFQPAGVDRLTVQLNEGLKYSLLKCDAKWTIRVATFKGNTVIDQNLIDEINNGRELETALDQAEKNAHRLTLALREKNWEAYEFHDRNSSIVTVGSFDALGTGAQSGQIQYNSEVADILRRFGAQRSVDPQTGAPVLGEPQSLAGIPLDIHPTPMEVPRKSITSDYARNFFLPR